MPQGLQVWDENGNLIVDTNSQIGKLLGEVVLNNITNRSGSITNSLLSSGIPYWFFGTNGMLFVSPPIITFSGNTMTWDWIAQTQGQTESYNVSVYYGIR